MEQNDRIEIRLLGRLHVRRADSSVIEASEWRTGKTIDLLRLLALEADRPVRIEGVLDKLWPEVDESRARASLRTAASQIRRTLRSNCIERRLGGLVLTNAWVDVGAFRSLATEAKSCVRSGQLARVVSLAREAEALYLKDFEAHDDESDWAAEVKGSLAALRRTLLADAADAAVTLRWMRDGIDLANRAIEADPCSERPHRALMQAYAGLGETEQALRAFEHCRVMLADELGADPSPQTRAVHLQVLSGHFDDAPSVRFVGRNHEVSATVAALQSSLRSERAGVVLVRGPVGSGRESVLVESTGRLEATPVRLAPSGPDGLPSAQQLERLASHRNSQVVLLPAVETVRRETAKELATTMRALRGPGGLVLAVPASAQAAGLIREAMAAQDITTQEVEVGPMSDRDLTALATAMLSGPVTASITDGLKVEAGSLAGPSVALLRRWCARGRVVSTAHGLELVPENLGTNGVPEIGRLVRQVLEQLSPLEMDVIHLAAVINAPVMPDMLVSLLTSAEGEVVDVETVHATLDRLTDLGGLTLGTQGYYFRHPLMRDAVDSWLRPTVRRRLHRRIAQSGAVSEENRALHWLQAGEPRRASESAIAAARVANGRGRRETVTAQLERAAVLLDGLSSSAAEHTAALEALGDAAVQLEAISHAQEAYEAAVHAATSADLPSVQRLIEKAERYAVGDAGPATGDHLTGFPKVLEILVETGWGQALEEHVRNTRELLSDPNGGVLEIRLSLPTAALGSSASIPDQRTASDSVLREVDVEVA